MLARTVDDFESRSGLRVDYQASAGLTATLAPRVQVELLRIVNEALTNVRKHADATTVRVNAEISEGEMLVTVRDNGRGFDQEEAFDQGMGLQGMRERARLIGGSLLVHSEISGGTIVEVRAPVAAPGVGSVSLTSERTTMASDESLEGTLPGTAARGAAPTAPDGTPKGVQP